MTLSLDAHRVWPQPQVLHDGLPFRQQTVAIVLAVVILLVVIELVRKRKLREEYSAVWIVTGLALLAMSIWTGLLTTFQTTIGAIESTSALFFGALLFLMLLSLQFSVRISKLTSRNKTLCQRMSLLERELKDLREELDSDSGPTIPRPDSPASSTTDTPLPAPPESKDPTHSTR